VDVADKMRPSADEIVIGLLRVAECLTVVFKKACRNECKEQRL
jgi:hypothetical protein